MKALGILLLCHVIDGGVRWELRKTPGGEFLDGGKADQFEQLRETQTALRDAWELDDLPPVLLYPGSHRDEAEEAAQVFGWKVDVEDYLGQPAPHPNEAPRPAKGRLEHALQADNQRVRRDLNRILHNAEQMEAVLVLQQYDSTWLADKATVLTRLRDLACEMGTLTRKLALTAKTHESATAA